MVFRIPVRLVTMGMRRMETVVAAYVLSTLGGAVLVDLLQVPHLVMRFVVTDGTLEMNIVMTVIPYPTTVVLRFVELNICMNVDMEIYPPLMNVCLFNVGMVGV